MSFHVPRIRLNLLLLEEYVSTRRNDVGLGIQYSTIRVSFLCSRFDGLPYAPSMKHGIPYRINF